MANKIGKPFIKGMQKKHNNIKGIPQLYIYKITNSGCLSKSIVVIFILFPFINTFKPFIKI